LTPQRLLIVTRRFWPLVGEAEQTMARLAAELTSRGVRVTIVTALWHSRWPAAVSYRGVPVVRVAAVPRDRCSTLQYVRRLAGWIRRHRDQYDLVYVSGLRHEACAALRAAGGKVPVIVRAESSGPQGDCSWQRQSPAGRWVRRACLRASAVIAPSRPIEAELIAGGYPRARIHRVPDGVPIPLPPTAQAKAAAREAVATAGTALELPPEAVLGVYTGPLELAQGLAGLVSAWVPIVARWPNARLWLVGQGPDEHALRTQMEARSLTHRVLLAGVFDEVEDLLTAADLFVLPAAPGGSRVALAEAMAAGLPIVAADLAEHRELVTDGREALLFGSSDAAALAETIARLLDDRPLAARLAAAARTRAAEFYSQAHMADEHLRLFEEIT
jgi:glycosyltransferase involved in cell wall biosynthesis